VYHAENCENYELLYLQFMDIEHLHDPDYVFPISLFKASETRVFMVESIKLVSFMEVISSKKIEIDGKTFGFEVIFTADWNGLLLKGEIDAANQNQYYNCSCGGCLKSRIEIEEDFKNQKSCKIVKSQEYLGATKIDRHFKLYCFGHGSARMLTNTLMNFAKVLPNPHPFNHSVAKALQVKSWKTWR
jgi:hypothetical protein